MQQTMDNNMMLALMTSVLPLASQNFVMLGAAAAQLFSGKRKRKH